MQRPLADRLPAIRPAKHDALIETAQMRRGEDVHPQARRFENCAQKGDDRPLAVGAGNVNRRRHGLMRIAKSAEQPIDTVERQIDGFRVQLLEPREQLGGPGGGSAHRGGFSSGERRRAHRAKSRIGASSGH